MHANLIDTYTHGYNGVQEVYPPPSSTPRTSPEFDLIFVVDCLCCLPPTYQAAEVVNGAELSRLPFFMPGVP